MLVLQVFGHKSKCWGKKNFDVENKELKSQPHGGARGEVRGSPKSAGYIVREPWIYVPNSVPIHVGDVEILERINENFDLLVALEEKSVHQS